MRARKKVKVTVIGLGKLGHGVIEAAQRAPDIEVIGAVETRLKSKKNNLPFPVKDSAAKIGDEEIAILCVPTNEVTKVATHYHELGISTVDSFDMHQEANWQHYLAIKKSTSRYKVRALTSGGTDPGLGSMVRALLQIAAPWGITYTNYGPGTSMGHTVVVRSFPGVGDAISVTIPKGFGLTRRDVFVRPETGADLNEIERKILSDKYYSRDEIHVFFVDDVESLYDSGHKVEIVRKGVSGQTHNQHFRFETIFTNNAMTGQLLVACARALSKQTSGTYTMIDLPLRDFLTPIKNEEDLFKEII